ncbi:neuronal acetylcholine receptor subunit non-alpha-3-like [Amphiura filiformis]|uniref:neuronal acetylcholine receptor subunit non-alpha-3-like n=1 Tax=Amphiura filiformis TaxID=82378 RepID=UPI003B2217BE
MFALKMNVLMIITIIMIMSFGIFGETISKTNSETKLIADLLAGYHPKVAPTDNGPVQVKMVFDMSYFDFIDEPKELAIAHGFVYRGWNDHRLQWNEADYNGTRRINLDRNTVWVPHIQAANSAKVTELLESQVLVFSTGRVRYYQSLQIEFLCDMDLRYFPYDKQSCNIEFGSSLYTTEHINLTASQTNGSRVNFAKDFQITTLDVQRSEKSFRFIAPYSFVDVTYTIGLKRVSSVYRAKLVVPSVLTSFLILATFLLPTASKEKITFCSNMFLCLLLLIAFLHTTVPSTVETILGQLLTFSLFVDFFATIMAVVSYNIKNKGTSIMTRKDYGVMLQDTTMDGDSGMRAETTSPKFAWLRYIDVISFAVFSFVFVIGLAAILNQRE